MQQNFASRSVRFSIAGCVVSLTIMVAGCASSHYNGGGSQGAGGMSGGSATDLYVSGTMAHQQGHDDEAIKQLKAAIAADPNLMMAHESLGDIYEQQQKYSDAAAEYAALIRLDPSSASSYRKLGAVQQLMGRPQDAIVSLDRAVDLGPSDARNLMALGQAYLTQGNVDEAVAYLRRATDLAPGDGKAWASLAVALDAEGHYQDAEAAYHTAIELAGPQTPTVVNLATNLLVQKKATEADTLLQQQIAREDTAQVRTLHGDALRMLNRASDAENEYKAALRLDPRDFGAINGLAALKIAQYQTSQKKDDQARRDAVDLWRQSLAIRAPQPQVEALLKNYEK